MDLKAGEFVTINPHSLEWKESKGEGVKLVQRRIGPFAIQERISDNVYRLEMDDRYPGSNVFNVQHLKKYHPSPEKFGPRSQMPETRITKPPKEEYPVERILAHRRNKKGKLQYLIRWEGYSPQFDTWEPEINIRNAPRFLYEYKALHEL